MVFLNLYVHITGGTTFFWGGCYLCCKWRCPETLCSAYCPWSAEPWSVDHVKRPWKSPWFTTDSSKILLFSPLLTIYIYICDIIYVYCIYIYMCMYIYIYYLRVYIYMYYLCAVYIYIYILFMCIYIWLYMYVCPLTSKQLGWCSYQFISWSPLNWWWLTWYTDQCFNPIDGSSWTELVWCHNSWDHDFFMKIREIICI